MADLKTPITTSAQWSKGHGDLDQYFDYVFGAHRPPMMPSGSSWHPAADLYETETEIVIIVDISGISVKDVNLVLHRNTMSLQGIRRERTGEPSRQYHTMEMAYGPFERVFNLPSQVRPDNVQADYRDGLLTIRLRKCSKPLRRKTTIRIR